MNTPNDPTPTQTQKPYAYCQICGKALTNETARRVGPAIYCEPCLADRLAGAPGPSQQPPPSQPGYGPVYAAGPAGFPPGSPSSSLPNPGLAALLGLIPGVGAMYNEQYAKGVVHLLIFAVLVMFANVSGIFGLFIMGWVFYMAIEAHHTAKARRDGTPLPNPFGFNDIGERMGFGRSWPSSGPAGPNVADAIRDAAQAASAAASDAAREFRSRPPIMTPPPASSQTWGAPTDAYGYAPPPGTPYAGTPYAGTPYAATNSVPYAPVQPPYPGTGLPPVAVPTNRLPTGAIWLIGLGMFFLLSTIRRFHGISGQPFIGIFLIAIGVQAFIRRITCTGATILPDGTPGYPLRAIRALRGSVWIALVGILMVSHGLGIMSWNYSWPWFLIVAGVLLLLERVATNAAAQTAPLATPYVAPVSDRDDFDPLHKPEHRQGGAL